MDDSASDEQLMQRYRDGEAAAFEALYARHKGPLYRYVLRLTGPAAVAEELFQDIWMNVIRARERYEVRAKFTTWLYRLAHNRVIDHYRREQARATVPADDDVLEALADDAQREPDGVFERRRLGARLLAALAQLPAAQREAFLLRHEAGLSLAAIAEVAEVDTETAKSRLRYALAKLRRALAPLGDAPTQERDTDYG